MKTVMHEPPSTTEHATRHTTHTFDCSKEQHTAATVCPRFVSLATSCPFTHTAMNTSYTLCTPISMRVHPNRSMLFRWGFRQ